MFPRRYFGRVYFPERWFGNFFPLPFPETSGTTPGDIYADGSGNGPFLYYETSGSTPDPIYEGE